jgi:hypothetical protein
VDAFPDFWRDDEDSDDDLAVRKAQVRATRTFADIHDVLPLDNFRDY